MPTFIEVCAGAGGLSTGLMHAGFTPLLLNDNNRDCCETLRRAHPGANVVCGDMQSLDVTAFKGKVDLLCGGIPCQPYALCGKRGGLDDPRGELMLLFRDLLERLRPRMFMIENVKGLVSHNGGETLAYILEYLNRRGLYDIQYSVLNAAEYGVPQKRERIFIVGTLHKLAKSDGNIYTFPEPIPENQRKVLRNVLTNVPPSPCAKYPAEKARLFGMIPAGGCWVNLPEAEQRAYMKGSYNSGGGKRGILRRLHMDAPSLTLLCTPSQKQTERCHPTEIRPLSVREYARIQTFPDSYEFSGSMASQYKQIGNAVPVELARHVGMSLIQWLTNTKN